MPSAPGINCTPGSDAARAARSPIWSADDRIARDAPLAAADVGDVVPADALSISVHLHGV